MPQTTKKRQAMCEKCFQPMDYAVRIMTAVGIRDYCPKCAGVHDKMRQEKPTHFFKDFRPKIYQVSK